MKRIFTSSLAFALCFTAFTQGQDVVWKSVNQAKPAQPAQPTPAQTQPLQPIQPSVTQVGAIAVSKAPASASTMPPVAEPVASSVEPPHAVAEEVAAPKLVVPSVPAQAAPITSPSVTIIAPPPTAVPHTVQPVPQGEASMSTSPAWNWFGPLNYRLPECAACSDGAPAVTGMIISSEVIDSHRFFIRAEALLWWTQGVRGPVLGTTGPLSSNGIIGAPGVSTVLNYNDLDMQFRPGARLKAGWWFDPCMVHGIDGSVFYLPARTGSYRATSGDLATLYRPFFVVNNNFAPTNNQPGEFSELVFARPMVLGEMAADLRSSFWGADANYRRNVWAGCTTRADAIVGFRYLNLTERLTITESIRPQVPVTYGQFRLPAGSVLSVQDQFKTRNDFYGGQIGADIEVRRNKWVFDIRPVVAFGVTREQLSVYGSQSVSPAQVAPPGSFNGGLFALSSNSGRFSRDPFTVVPELTFNVGYQFNEHWKIFGGYNFLYWSNVIRPGDQIDRNIDVTRIPNFLRPNENVPPVAGNRPAVLLNDTDFWAQGVNLGVEYRW